MHCAIARDLQRGKARGRRMSSIQLCRGVERRGLASQHQSPRERVEPNAAIAEMPNSKACGSNPENGQLPVQETLARD